MILDKLIEKKDIKSYLEFRMKYLRLIETPIKMSQFPENRSLIDERFKGRNNELKKLLNVILEGDLKDKSKFYYNKIKEMKSDEEE